YRSRAGQLSKVDWIKPYLKYGQTPIKDPDPGPCWHEGERSPEVSVEACFKNKLPAAFIQLDRARRGPEPCVQGGSEECSGVYDAGTFGEVSGRIGQSSTSWPRGRHARDENWD